MKPSAQNPSRNRSRGPRRGKRGGRPNHNNNQQSYRPSAPPKPKTLWEKILAFFGIGKTAGKSSASNNRSRNNAPAAARTDKPASSAPREREYQGSSTPKPARAERQKRPPEMVEVTSSRLYIGNLSFDATESDLQDLFNGVGVVQAAEVVSNPHTHRSKGFAFVQMTTIEEAKRAVRELHNKDFMGRPLVVSGAKSQREEDEANSDSENAASAVAS